MRFPFFARFRAGMQARPNDRHCSIVEEPACLSRFAWDLRCSGGPAENESLASWRARLRPQQEAERDEEQEKVPVRRSSPTTQGGEARGSNAAPIGGTSFSQEGEDAEHLLRAQVASFASLEELTRNNGESLEEVKLLIETSPTGSFTYGAKFSDTDKLRELDRLAEMAKALCEVAVSAT